MKRVIDENGKVVLLGSVHPQNIYAVKSPHSIFKLHKVNDRWMFCDMKNSNCGHSGIYETLERTISVAMEKDNVFEFDNLVEFSGWLRENINEG